MSLNPQRLSTEACKLWRSPSQKTSVLIPGAIKCVSALLLQAAGIPQSAEPIRFLPDDAQVACRAILPQCFRREDWARLCRDQLDIREAHPVACELAEES